ncbi:unnamed protein product [Staurois parvus]|uniref:Uncharacterized protein n=1 Tax=Staurois parvus TaxID=386267 RepID=A0ABN9B5V7_9NEOB|nr:unnamed protein product [Staurois parvus]
MCVAKAFISSQLLCVSRWIIPCFFFRTNWAFIWWQMVMDIS